MVLIFLTTVTVGFMGIGLASCGTVVENSSVSSNKENNSESSVSDDISSSVESSDIDIADGLSYSLRDDGTYLVAGTGKQADLVIPSTHKGKPVTAIAFQAFYRCDWLKSIVIPDSVTSIGHNAFWGCHSLTSVVIGNGITAIEKEMFNFCDSLESVTLGDNITSIGEFAFSACSSLTNIEVSESNTAYCDIDGNLYNKEGTSLFQYAVGKTETQLIIPKGVKFVNSNGFNDCANLQSVVLPLSVCWMSNTTFKNCENVISIYYNGTSMSTARIELSQYNGGEDFENATVYFYSSTSKSKHWHFDENGTAVLWSAEE